MDAVERLQAGNLYAEVPRGLFLIRGENVVLLGEIVRAFLSCRNSVLTLLNAPGSRPGRHPSTKHAGGFSRRGSGYCKTRRRSKTSISAEEGKDPLYAAGFQLGRARLRCIQLVGSTSATRHPKCSLPCPSSRQSPLFIHRHQAGHQMCCIVTCRDHQQFKLAHQRSSRLSIHSIVLPYDAFVFLVVSTAFVS